MLKCFDTLPCGGVGVSYCFLCLFICFGFFPPLNFEFLTFSQRRSTTNELLAVSSCCIAKKACNDLDYNEVYMTLCPRLMVTLYGMKCTVQTQLEW